MTPAPWHLIDAHLERELTEAGSAELTLWLAKDPSHLRVFACAVHDHAALAEHFRFPAAEAGIEPQATRTPASTGIRLPVLRWALIGLAALATALLALWLNPGPDAAGGLESIEAQGVAELERAGVRRGLVPGETLLAGDILRTSGRGAAAVEFVRARIQVRLGEHTSIAIPESTDPRHLRLLNGALGIDASRLAGGLPLVLRTANGLARVPRSKVEAFASPGSTRLRVTQGRIEFTTAGTQPSFELEAGEAVVLGRGEPMIRPASHPAVPATEAPASPFGVNESAPAGRGGVLRETWLGVPGRTVDDLRRHPGFPGRPDRRDFPAGLESAEGNSEQDLYGSRWRGYLHPPETGLYTFWIAADDAAQLLLATDERPDSAIVVAEAHAYTDVRAWTQYPEQESVEIRLERGQRYYLEILHKEHAGGDHLAVAWGRDSRAPELVTGDSLSPYQP